MRTAEYDVEAAPSPGHKLLICAAPRTSSKRLARLLLASGIGVPMEYFNPNGFRTLITRWGINKRDYLSNLYRRRSANGVFATNMQNHQIRAWPYPRDFVDLFDHATVIYLVRRDKVAQGASLAACLLTGDWGFAGEAPEIDFPERKLRKAARQALKFIDEEDQQWTAFFMNRGITPLTITDEQVNRDNKLLLEEIAASLEIQIDFANAEKMLLLDRGPYRVNKNLKDRLCAIVHEVRKNI
jgi:LPS sulfotransferase NodH